MLTGRFRIEVSDEHGTTAMVIDPPALTAGQQKALGRAVDRVAGHVRAVLGTSEDHAREILLTALARQYADEAAYERVTRQRGLLL